MIKQYSLNLKIVFALGIFLYCNNIISSEYNNNYLHNLILEEKYFEAINEADNSFARKLLSENNYYFITAACYYSAEQYNSAYHISSQNSFQKGNSIDNKLLFAYSAYFSGHVNQAISTLQSFDYNNIDENNYNSTAALQSRIFLDELKFEELYNYLNKTNKLKSTNYTLTLLQASSKYKDLNFKSKTAAGILSAIIPGSGQFYCGYFKSGIVTFTSTLILAGASWYCFSNDYNSAGIIFSASTITMYSGAIFTGYKSAEKYNYNQKIAFYNKMLPLVKDKYCPIKIVKSMDF